MEPVPCKPLQGEVLCAPSGLRMDAPYPCKVSDDKGINAIVLVKGVKGLLMLLHLIGVETVDLCGKGASFAELDR